MPRLQDLVLSGTAVDALPSSFSASLGTHDRRSKANALRLEGLSLETIPARLTAWCEETRTDFALVPAGLSIKEFGLAFFDMDRTLIENECIDDLALLFGKSEEISTITRRSMIGELNFDESLKARVAMLKGLPEKVLHEAIGHTRPTKGCADVLKFFHENGINTYILSGGFVPFAEHVRELYGITGFLCNELVFSDGILTGDVTGPAGGAILNTCGKREALLKTAAEKGLTASQCIAGGDGANDMLMIAEAGLGFAYHGKPKVQSAAPRSIRFGDFSVVLDWFVENWD